MCTEHQAPAHTKKSHGRIPVFTTKETTPFSDFGGSFTVGMAAFLFLSTRRATGFSQRSGFGLLEIFFETKRHRKDGMAFGDMDE